MIKSKKTILEELNRIRGLMGVKLINEQEETTQETPDTTNLSIGDEPSYDPNKIQQITFSADTDPNDYWIVSYKNSCGNNPNLVIPSKNKFGAKGEEIIIYYEKKELGIEPELPKADYNQNIDTTNLKLLTPSQEDSLGFNKDYTFNPTLTRPFCLYKSPKIYGSDKYIDINNESVNAIWIPDTAKPFFFDSYSLITKIVENFIKQFVNTPTYHDGKIGIQEVRKNLNQSIALGDLYGFEFNGKQYSLSFKYDEIYNKVRPTGYLTLEGGQKNGFYKTPQWKDPRNDYQRFIDNNGLYIQIGAAIGVTILGIATGNPLWVLYTEIAVEGILGAMVAQREFERGDNVSGTFSLIFAGLPAAKLSKVFRGVDPETFKSLGEKLARNPDAFKSETNFDNLIKNVLDDDESKLLKEALKRDETTWYELGKSVDGDVITKQLKKEALTYLEKNPDLIKDVEWHRKIWAREWGANIAAMIVSFFVERKFGKVLNSEQKKTLEQVFSYIPESLQKELYYNLILSIEMNGEIKGDDLIEIKNFYYSDTVNRLKSKKRADIFKTEFNKMMKSKIKETFKDSYQELPETSEYKVSTRNIGEKDSLIKNGAINIFDFDSEKLNTNDYNFTHIEGTDEYFYVPKNNNKKNDDLKK